MKENIMTDEYGLMMVWVGLRGTKKTNQISLKQVEAFTKQRYSCFVQYLSNLGYFFITFNFHMYNLGAKEERGAKSKSNLP